MGGVLFSPASAATRIAPFTAYVGPGNPTGLNGVASALGYEPTFASDNFDQRSWAGIDDDQWDIHRWQNSGYQMIWGVPLLPTTTGVSLAAGATGAYNSYFTALAVNLVAAGMGNSILRLGWEFNQETSPWYAAGQSATFVAYWRQIVTTMRSEPGAHFQFEWNPNRGNQGASDQAVGNLADYYPGDPYVDIVGLDVYDTAWQIYPGATAEFQHIVTQPWGLSWLAAFGATHAKPLAIPELGLGWGPSAHDSGPLTGSGALSGGDDPTFMADIFGWVVHHNVTHVVFWDSGSSSIENGQNPSTAAALVHALPLLSDSLGPRGGAGYRQVASDGGISK
jgi:hypothetical protein